MSSATLDALYDAVFDAVEGVDGFKCVAEFGGELTPETISQAASSRLPAALVAVAGEEAAESTAYETTSGEIEVIAEAQLVVYVAVQAIRGPKAAHEGAGGAPGLFALCSRVIAAVNGLRVPELWGNGFVKYARLRPVLFRPGNTGVACVYAVSFRAERIAEQLDPQEPAGAVPLDEARGDLDLAGASTTLDPQGSPVVLFDVPGLND